MKKSASKGGGSKSKKATTPSGMTAADHRKASREHFAKGRLHDAKADLMDAKNPPKQNGPARGGY